MSTQVRVIGHYRVVHNGQAYTAADGEVEVPDQVAKRWQLYGWAEPVAEQADTDQADAEQAEHQAAKPKRARRSDG